MLSALSDTRFTIHLDVRNIKEFRESSYQTLWQLICSVGLGHLINSTDKQRAYCLHTRYINDCGTYNSFLTLAEMKCLV